MFVIAATGHRPDKLGGYSDEVSNRLKDLAKASLVRYQPDQVITGVTIGWDFAVALAALELDIPLVSAVAFKGMENRWSHKNKETYDTILSKSHVHIISKGGYSADSFKACTIWMLMNSSTILALWNGSAGGTGNCIKIAKQREVPIINVWKSWEKYKGI